MSVQLITPFLWFDGQAEEAAKFYTGIFPNSRIVKVAKYPEGSPAPVGSVVTVEFELDGQSFVGLNAGPAFKFTEAISFAVNCETQEEVDKYWDALSAGGGEVECGWVKDKFGLSWQITPIALMKQITNPDPATASRAMKAMMTMKKFDIRALEAAGKVGRN